MNQQHNFQSDTFRDLMESITRNIPALMFFGIVITYIVTAALNVHIIPLPAYIAVPAAAMIQFGRFAVVFMDFLNPTGYRSKYPPVIATVATVVAMVELGFSVQDIAEASSWSQARYWSVYLFGAMLIGFGYILELNFIEKGAEAYGMRTFKRNVSVEVTPQSRPAVTRNQQPALVTAEKRPEIMRELREKQEKQAQPEQGQNQVATRVYAQPDALETAAQIKVDQRTLRAYRHKLRNGIGNPVTNQTHIDRLEAKIEDMKAQLG
jgi:hypothetical protein